MIYLQNINNNVAVAHNLCLAFSFMAKTNQSMKKVYRSL
jgi:hypothetical protein